MAEYRRGPPGKHDMDQSDGKSAITDA